MISIPSILAVVKNSRWYSSDMTIFSCLVCFLYAIADGGNAMNGIIAFIGILFAHMATNLYDDYEDYKLLCADIRLSEFTPEVKCAYLKKGSATVNDLLFVIVLYCAIAFFTGVFLFFRVGVEVFYLAVVGAIIVLSYPRFSRVGLSEIAVGIAFGPLLFEGMYFVMTKHFSFELLILALSIVMFTVGVMYNHTILDYEADKASCKRTLVQKFSSKNTAIWGSVVIYAFGYAFLGVFSLISKNYFSLVALITIPLVYLLLQALKRYNSAGYYMRNQDYLNVLVGSAKVMALFSFLVAVGLGINLYLPLF